MTSNVANFVDPVTSDIPARGMPYHKHIFFVMIVKQKKVGVVIPLVLSWIYLQKLLTTAEIKILLKSTWGE